MSSRSTTTAGGRVASPASRACSLSEYATRTELLEAKRELAQADVELRAQILETERTLRAEQRADLATFREDINEVKTHLTAQDGTLDAVQKAIASWTKAVVGAVRWATAVAATVSAYLILHFIFGF